MWSEQEGVIGSKAEGLGEVRKWEQSKGTQEKNSGDRSESEAGNKAQMMEAGVQGFDLESRDSVRAEAAPWLACYLLQRQ